MLPLKVGLLLLCIKMSTSVETNGKNLADPKILLENKTLEVIVGHFPPSTIINTNDNGTTIGFDGLLIQFIDWLSHYSKFKYNLFELEKNVKGKYDRDKEEWSGMIAYLVNETADLALAKFGATNKRTNGMGFAGFIDGDNTALLVDYPKAIVSYSGALEPFTGTVWMLFILGLAVMIFVSWIIIKIRVKYFTETTERKYRLNTLSDVILYFLSAFFNQGVFHSRAYQSMGFISPITWCFAAFVIVNSYTTTLTSFLSVQTRQPKINSFKDLAKFERYKVMIGRGTISHIDLLAAKNGSLKIVGDRIRNCKFCPLETWEEMGRGVLGELDDPENQYVGIGVSIFIVQIFTSICYVGNIAVIGERELVFVDDGTFASTDTKRLY